jgi:hypothetical protein
MGYTYIWIGALCILEDLKEDWQTESIKMGSIYRTSILTIAAMGAPECLPRTLHVEESNLITFAVKDISSLVFVVLEDQFDS